MINFIYKKGSALIIIYLLFMSMGVPAQSPRPPATVKAGIVHVIAFYTAKHDPAHISFVHEANRWFPEMGKEYGFTYDSTNDWTNLNTGFLSKYQVVLFLDTRPELPGQRMAFQQYMENGGAWMGFHFAAFALTPSDYPQNWDWYHNTFLGSGSYVSNTWRPVSAILRVENSRAADRQPADRQSPDQHRTPVISDRHPVTWDLPDTIYSAPNEWYRWSNDLRANPDIRILLSIDSTSFPLGTGPKQSEIWHSGYYPVVWTNKRFKMIYFNMGHNDIDYEHKTNKELSSTFQSKAQDTLILHSLRWLGSGEGANRP